MTTVTKRKASEKPSKPYPEFPLSAHASGKWQKKIRGHVHYFGRWEDPDGALAEYQAVAEYLHAGLEPPRDTTELLLGDLCNVFLDHKDGERQAGKLSDRHFADLKESCEILLRYIPRHRKVHMIRASDFLPILTYLQGKYGVHRRGSHIARIRTTFNFAYNNELIEAPIRFGSFKKPERKEYRARKNETRDRLYAQGEIRLMISKANRSFRGMILLAINCGFGPEDCAQLPLKSVDLESGWLDWHRPKTQVPRRAKLWPETIEALKVVLDRRKDPVDKDAAKLFFLTRNGTPYTGNPKDKSPISRLFLRLLNRNKIESRGGMYSLRRTFQTVADQTERSVAIRCVMGHADESMSEVYRQKAPDESIEAVCMHVHAWLYGGGDDE